MNPYNEPGVAKDYLAFLSSENGQIQTQVLESAIRARLGINKDIEILDAATGSGWLAGHLHNEYKHIQGCDGSGPLIEQAKTNFPEVKFEVADLISPLPYQPLKFDFVILNMAILDLDNIKQALEQLHRVIKNEGKLIVTLPNPYYNYPLGVWKSGLTGKLLGKKPSLKLQHTYFHENPTEKTKTWGSPATSYTQSLEYYISNCIEAGFTLSHFGEIKTAQDSGKFNLQYQLYRFPLMLLLEFKKV